MRRPQIGVIGSTSDLNYEKNVEEIAERVGELIAEKGGTLFFGAEKHHDSLSTAACRGAKKKGGLTIGITHSMDKEVWGKDMDVVVATGSGKGGGREFVLILCCDAVIAIGGGSGTLTEMAVAYQAGIPVIAINGTGGWSNRLAGQHLDERKRLIIETAETPEEAVEFAFKKANETNGNGSH